MTIYPQTNSLIYGKNLQPEKVFTIKARGISSRQKTGFYLIFYLKFFVVLILTGSFVNTYAQDVIINEVMASNNSFISDEDGSFEDWIELYNNGSSPVNLEGYGLSDDYDDPFKWILPEYVLQPGEYLLIWASGKDRKPQPRTMINGIQRLYYPGIPGSSVDDLIQHPSFPDDPAQRNILINYFEAPTNIADDYGQHLYTWITPPQTGEYRFWIASDDNSALHLSTDESPDNTTMIASVPGWTHPREWDKYYHQQSGWIHLEEGSYYYISALMKEGWGGDNLAVKWEWPDGTIEEPLHAAHGYIPAARWHTNFRISASGEELTLTHPDGHLIDEMAPVAIPTHISYGRIADQDYAWGYFDNPTPEAANDTSVSFDGITAQPVLSPPGGIFHQTVTISIIHTSPQAQIYYTTDGSEPSSSNGILYDGPFEEQNASYVRAVAVEEDKLPSEITGTTYTVAHTSLHDFSGKLPLMVIHQFNNPVSPGNRTPAYMSIWDNDNSMFNELNKPVALSSRIKINIRGSSSQMFPKNNFGFHILTEQERNRKEVLLDMPEEHNWTLHGPYSDKTLMRNAYSYAIAEDMGYYSPRTRFIELFMHTGNNKIFDGHYHGVYVLTERIKIAPGRVEIEDMETHHNSYPEVSGGYIFKYDRLNEGEVGFTTQRGSLFSFVRPNEETASIPQKQYLTAYLDSLESTLFDDEIFTDPQNGYRRFIDTKSFIDMHLITELTKEIDGYRLSTFFTKDRQGKISSGPLWDFNLSLGNANYLQGWLPQGWYYELISEEDYLYGWYNRLFLDPDFEHEYNRRYRFLRLNTFSSLQLNHKMMENFQLLENAAERNFHKWDVLGSYVWPNWFIGDSFEEEVFWMAQWLNDRVEWMDSQLGEPYTMIHLWDFNKPDTFTAPTYSIQDAELNISLASESVAVADADSHFRNLNNRDGHPSSGHLSIQNPAGTELTFNVSSSQYQHLIFSYEANRSDNGANRHIVSFTHDGEHFQILDTLMLTTTPQWFVVDLEHAENVNDNDLLAVKITIEHDDSHPGGWQGYNAFNNITLDGEALEDVIRPPVQKRILPHKIALVENESNKTTDLAEYFKHPDGYDISYEILSGQTNVADVYIENSQLIINPLLRGGDFYTLKVTDNINPPLIREFYVLVYPEAIQLADENYLFNFWSPEEPEGSFPDHMLFVQSNSDDPGPTTPLVYAYSIPADDYASDDQQNIGFPYKNNSRTRINGLNNNGISLINTGRGRDLGAAILAVDTRDVEQGYVTWKASTIRQNSRVYHMRLQYRNGNTGAWRDWKDSDGNYIEYQRNSPGHSQVFENISIPESALNQPYVQIRWLYYYTGHRVSQDSGARDMLALNEVSVVASAITNTDNIDPEKYQSSLIIYPNPAAEGRIGFNRKVTGNIVDIRGRKIASLKEERTFDTQNLNQGIYIFIGESGKALRFIVP